LGYLGPLILSHLTHKWAYCKVKYSRIRQQQHLTGLCRRRRRRRQWRRRVAAAAAAVFEWCTKRECAGN